MRSSAAFVAIVLALVCAARASAVLDLTTEKFDETLKANPKGVLVEFFAPWCGHCQKLAPEYDKAAELLGSKAVLAKVDCTKENDLCGKHNIQGFPTLLWFQDGLPSPCNTERSAKGISEFVSNKLGELVDEGKSKVKVLTTANFNHTLKDIDAVVEFYAPWCGHCKDLAPKFEEAAETASEILFGKVNCDLNGELCQSYKVEGYPSIQFIRNLKGSPYNGERTVQALVEFARGKSEEFKSTNVIDLGDDFDSALSLNPKILVEFYAPWCGHCKALAPEYEKAATEMKGKIPVAKVDCTAHNELCTKYNIQGYPSIKFFEDGNPSDYQGERAASSIVAFLKKKLEGPVILVTSQAQLDEIEASGVVIIGFFTNDKDGMFDTFNQVARNPTTQDLTFAAVTDELAKKNAKTLPSIKFVRGEDVGEPLWWTQPHFKLFEEWIRNHELPLVGEIGPGTFKKYVDSGKDLIAIFLDPATKKETIEQVKEVAAAQTKYNFGWSDGIQWASIVERWLGKAPESLPVVIFLSFSEDYQLGMEGAFSTAALTKFANDLASGALKHTPKSEPVPAEQLDAVFTVVGSTLEEVINQKKDVLVEFYAPWCGHCKSLAPIYEAFAKAVESVDSLVIAKIDAVANDVKHVVGKNAVTGFPTILFFPADAKQMPGIVYDGERTVQGFADFLHKRASISWKNPAALDTLLKEGVTDDHSGHAHGAHDEL